MKRISLSLVAGLIALTISLSTGCSPQPDISGSYTSAVNARRANGSGWRGTAEVLLKQTGSSLSGNVTLHHPTAGIFQIPITSGTVQDGSFRGTRCLYIRWERQARRLHPVPLYRIYLITGPTLRFRWNSTLYIAMARAWETPALAAGPIESGKTGAFCANRPALNNKRPTIGWSCVLPSKV